VNVACEAEVGDLDDVIGGNEDVSGGEVAVDAFH
jgi:hypothetical protein